MELWGARVVAVDDDPDTLEVVRLILQQRGAELIAEGAPGAALTTIVGVMPDALLVDISMPQLDGLALLRNLRRLSPEKGGRIPAATLSAAPVTPERLAAWRHCGFQAHVPKPFDPDALLACVALLVRSTVERRQELRPRDAWPGGVSRNRRGASG
jgi:CheY-like chemotaxis protein